jgi:hypothetical protein
MRDVRTAPARFGLIALIGAMVVGALPASAALPLSEGCSAWDGHVVDAAPIAVFPGLRWEAGETISAEVTQGTATIRAQTGPSEPFTVVGPNASVPETLSFVLEQSGTYGDVAIVSTENGVPISATLSCSVANIVTNGSFETNTAGWKANSGTTMSRGTTVFDSAPASARLLRTGSVGMVVINDRPNWLTTTIAGTRCTASAAVMGATGKTALIRMREYQGGTRRSTAIGQVALDGTWKEVSVSVDVVAGDNTMDLSVYGKRFARGQAMHVDDVSLTCVAVPVELVTQLTGAAEVPGPGDPDGSGEATITVDLATSEVCWSLSVSQINPAIAAHIHIGSATVAGPVVAPLTPPDPTSSGCQIDAALAAAIVADPANYYVNVHTADYPAGAIRGQLG